MQASVHARSQSQSLISSPAASHSRRPSLSSPMHWLSRSNSPPVRPEPKRTRTLDIAPPRSGTLGAGATVVRTPDEALRETGVRLAPDRRERPLSSNDVTPSAFIPAGIDLDFADPPVPPVPPVPPMPASPPLPPLPNLDSEDEATLAEPDSPAPKSPPRPTRAPPPPPSPVPAPRVPSLRSSLKVRSSADDAPAVPPLPAQAALFTQPLPFAAVLISDPPSVAIDAAKTIVAIETCTDTFKTTLATIRSRPSHLAKFISALYFSPHHDSTASLYSAESEDLSTYRRHLTSQGLLPHSSTLHLFLDRPAAPYPHIFTYLRTPPLDGQPEALPRALQLQASLSPSARLESLIEVRDEAAFLGLDALQRLCADEIRIRYGPRLHSRGQSSSAASVQSQHASVYSTHALPDLHHMDQQYHNHQTQTSPFKLDVHSQGSPAPHLEPSP